MRTILAGRNVLNQQIDIRHRVATLDTSPWLRFRRLSTSALGKTFARVLAACGLKQRISRIPKIVHYVFGMADDFGGKPWGLVHHACLMSAVTHIKPDRILMHCALEPTGPWWGLSRPFMEVNRIAPPLEIFGRPLLHVAHRAGVVRLQALIEHGGIYLDADVLVQRDFDDLLDYPTVLGTEGEHEVYGMADAVILARKGSPFLARWLDAYRSFRSKGQDEHWAEHAVAVPSALAKQHPSEIHVLPYTAFYWPLWTPEHLRWMYETHEPIEPGAYAHHLWEALAFDYFRDLTPGRVRAVDTNFHRRLAGYVRDLPDDFGACSGSAEQEAAPDATPVNP